jgi:hypothetical protein
MRAAVVETDRRRRAARAPSTSRRRSGRGRRFSISGCACGFAAAHEPSFRPWRAGE